MKLKDGLKLRKIGNRYLMADACGKDVNLTSVFALNEVAARMWQEAAKGEFTAESLAEVLCKEYEVEPAEARVDVEAQLAQWKEYGLIDG